METPTAPRRQVLLVLGVHRSGTSATAGLLAQLGAGMAAHPIRADANNPAGYWEPEPIVSLHNRLLAEAGSAWDDWGRLDTDALADARDDLAAAFRAEFGEPEGDAPGLLVLKDPRICRFLPLWQGVLADVGALPRAVLPLRHPQEVAASLARRDGMAAEDALLLWLRHVLEAEAGTRDMPRAFLRYDDLLADWRAAAARIAATLGLAWPLPVEEAAPAVEAFLSRDLRHHAAPSDADLPAWAAEGWAALSALGEGDGDGDGDALPRLDALRAALDAGDALMGAAARRQAREAAAALGHHEAVRAALAAHVAELEAAHGEACASRDAHAAHVAELEAARGEALAARDAHAAHVA